MRAEVADSYIYAYPLVLMDVAKEAATGGDGAQPGQAPLNTLRHAQALPPVGAVNPPLPGVDTLDSTGWLDVAAEPVIVTLPDTRGRYWDARALDMWTNVLWSSSSVAARGARGAGRSQTIAFAAKDWQGTLPKGVQRVDVPSANAWLEVRLQTSGGRDLTNVKKLQRAIRVVPLSVYTGAERGASVAVHAGSAPSEAVGGGTPAEQVAALDPKAFFTRFARALQDNPAPADDAHAQESLGDIGVTAGYPVLWTGDRLTAATAGVAEARAARDPAVEPAERERLDLARRYGRQVRPGLRAARVCGLHAVRHRDARRRDARDHPRRQRRPRAERREPVRAAFRAGRAAAGARVLDAHAVHHQRRVARRRVGAPLARRSRPAAPQPRRLDRHRRVGVAGRHACGQLAAGAADRFRARVAPVRAEAAGERRLVDAARRRPEMNG